VYTSMDWWTKIRLEVLREGKSKREILRREGISWETLKEINPRLIYCSISGFGQTGPYADRAGFDPIAQGMSGIASITGWKHTGPVRVGVAIGDSLGGICATYGILLAIIERQRSGQG